jgi:hypothetical protein
MRSKGFSKFVALTVPFKYLQFMVAFPPRYSSMLA